MIHPEKRTKTLELFKLAIQHRGEYHVTCVYAVCAVYILQCGLLTELPGISPNVSPASIGSEYLQRTFPANVSSELPQCIDGHSAAV